MTGLGVPLSRYRERLLYKFLEWINVDPSSMQTHRHDRKTLFASFLIDLYHLIAYLWVFILQKSLRVIRSAFAACVVGFPLFCTLRSAYFTSEVLSIQVISGGVASNMFIRDGLTRLCNHYNCSIVCPPPRLCTDNGVMIAWYVQNGCPQCSQHL